jgi:predicted oxidoreductase
MQLHKIQPMAWNPLGDIFRADTEKVLRIRQVLIALEDKYNTTADVLLLAWILKHPGQIQPVVGTANQEHIKRLKQLSQIKLELEDWFMLYSASLGERVP